MYFSNIANEELQYFHNTGGVDFSMSLTDILSSDLFRVETVVANHIYRVFPLFYCKEVISSNANDILLDTRCLILQISEHETYLSFITNSPRNNTILDENTLNIKNIGDILTTEEFNALVYRLRQKGNLSGTLNFEEKSKITGVYATYEFNNVEGQLRNDTGIIVNDKVKNYPLTVKLTNPFFLNANYKLTFTVRSISGANVCEEGKSDLITKDTFSIILVEGSEVSIPLTNYINDSILDFDVAVSISFNVPEIVNSNFNLDLEVDKDNILISENINLIATLTGEDNISDYLMYFFEDNILIGSDTTNEEGIASLNHIPSTVGNHIYSVSVVGLKSEVNVSVNKLTTDLSISVDKESVLYGESVNLIGTLLVNNQPVENLPVKLYDNNILITTLTTDSNGNVSFNSNNLGTGNNDLKLVYDETTEHKSNNASITVIVKIPTRIFIQRYTSPPIYAYDTTYEIEGILYNSLDDTRIANKSINIQLDGRGNVTTVTTDENGIFTHQRGFSHGNHQLECTFNGDTYYAPSSITQQVTVIRRETEFKDVTIKANTISGYLVLSGTNEPIKRARVEVLFEDIMVHGCTTNDEGYFVNSQINGGQNYSPKFWNYLRYDGDIYNSSLNLDISNFAVLRTSRIVDISQNNPNYESFNHIGKLIDDLNNPIPNATIKIKLLSNNYSFSTVTDENGLFTVNTVQDTGIECIFEGDIGIEGCNGIVK